uniref:GH10 domain-containing protein n=2 Tax=Kalanchoe fedtschenkoi TaxID=63787 RepID=A0A7N0ZWT2_KALFE
MCERRCIYNQPVPCLWFIFSHCIMHKQTTEMAQFRDLPRPMLMLVCSLLLATSASAFKYDHTASIECLERPHGAQYGGGMVANPEMDGGVAGWGSFRGARVEGRVGADGNRFVVASWRNSSYGSVSQRFWFKKDHLYAFSAWVQVSEGSGVPVKAMFRTRGGYRFAGAVMAEAGCWSMLKGGLTAQQTGVAELYFESKNATVEIWVDSVSLQPFTKDEWRSHQAENTELYRKGRVRVQAVDASGRPLAGANVSLHQNELNFPFGCAINKHILANTAYQNWFSSRFKHTTFEDELKWYATEKTQGQEDYADADALLQFAKKNGVSVRGHNIFWNDPKMQPSWVPSLAPEQLRAAADKRMNSVVSRFKGQVIHWDVVNENLHFKFFEDKLGADFSAKAFQAAHQLDSGPIKFLNEYNTLEQKGDADATPANYLKKLKEMPSGVPLGIGLEGHFDAPDIAYMRSALDTLAAANLPIWITELDVANTNQAEGLEQIINEATAHPAIRGIVIWGAWKPSGCYRMCLTDNSFSNLPTGDVIDKMLDRLKHKSLTGATDQDGFFETSLYHGSYDVSVTHQDAPVPSAGSFQVSSDGNTQLITTTVQIQVSS